MSAEIPTPSVDDLEHVRRATGVATDHTPLYSCDRCGHRKPSAQFPLDKYGEPDRMCQNCHDRIGLSRNKQRYYKDRSHITITEKHCRICEQMKPTDCFWLDGKTDDGLKPECASCTMKRRRGGQGKTVPTFDSFTPASTVQPILDAAIAERDALADEVRALQDAVDGLRRKEQSQGPRTDLLALNAIETELRWLRQRLDAPAPRPSIIEPYVKHGLSLLGTTIGPVAFRVFKWADRQVLKDEHA